MATGSSSDNWHVEDFTINPKGVLGQGAYGVVYRAVDSKGNNVAAKRIDLGRKHALPNINKDVKKLKELNNPNIVKVYTIHREQDVVWIIMELCEHGDLNNFYRNTQLTQEQLLTVMEQISAGVKYLHQKNIVHRDIKPENILVYKDSPIQIKLTDFDVSKFFDDVFDTSAMSTNVGTLAFKAPEFFQRTPEGKIVYHRNVDVYAMGLTFLALLQANRDTKQLKPHIETPQDHSEMFALSIGQLIAERVKYKVKELRIVHVKASSFLAENALSRVAKNTHDLKVLVEKMTCVDPRQRLYAADVCDSLRLITKVNFIFFILLSRQKNKFKTGKMAMSSVCYFRKNF